jgi:hypothetical protein
MVSTAQVTLVLALPVTLAEKVCGWVVVTAARSGEMVTATLEAGVEAVAVEE